MGAVDNKKEQVTGGGPSQATGGGTEVPGGIPAYGSRGTEAREARARWTGDIGNHIRFCKLEVGV